MGIDYVSLESILISSKMVKDKKNMLTLGRQQIHIQNDKINEYLNKYKISNTDCQINEYCENFFKKVLNFQHVESIDNSVYEEDSDFDNFFALKKIPYFAFIKDNSLVDSFVNGDFDFVSQKIMLFIKNERELDKKNYSQLDKNDDF